MRILVVRFRQMGDAILTTVVLNTLRKSFPDSVIDFVLNDKICPLFEGHPSIDHLIPFTNDERHHALTYIHKVWLTVHRVHYDVIIDMRSTANTMLFALFSPSTKFRIGLRKGYTAMAFNCLVDKCGPDGSMIDHNLAMVKPLEAIAPIQYDRNFTLVPTTKEQTDFCDYMIQNGIDMHRPILLAGVTAKLANKTWDEDRMVEVIRRFMKAYPSWQIIFNYAPGKEEENARRMYLKLGSPHQVFIDIQAKSQRQLLAMASLTTMYFGNEGGARHIVHACGKPSFVVCAPQSSKKIWIPQNETPAGAIAAEDIVDVNGIPMADRYALITVDAVWQRLTDFMSETLGNSLK